MPGLGLLVPGGNTVRLYQTSGTLTRTYTSTAPDVRAVSYSSALQEVHGHPNGGSTVTWLASTGASLFTTPVPAGVRGISSRAGLANGIVTFGSQDLRLFNYGSLIYTAPQTFTQMNSYWCTAYGHDNRVYVGGISTAGSGAIMTFDTSMNRVSNPWVVSGTTSIVSMATVVAPEPGTMIALGAGLVALLRRKKR